MIAGISNDQATMGHPGTRYGPERMREISNQFIRYNRNIFTMANRGWYSNDMEKIILKNIQFMDVGNVVHHLSEDLMVFYKRCYQAACAIYKKKAFPVFIGGDHSISAPLILACRKKTKILH